MQLTPSDKIRFSDCDDQKDVALTQKTTSTTEDNDIITFVVSGMHDSNVVFSEHVREKQDYSSSSSVVVTLRHAQDCTCKDDQVISHNAVYLKY